MVNYTIGGGLQYNPPRYAADRFQGVEDVSRITWRKLIDLYTTATLLWALAWRGFGDRWGLLGMANAWAFWLLGTGTLAGGYSLWRRARWLAGGWLIGGAALLATRYRYLWRRSQPPMPDDDPPDDWTLRVLSFNLLTYDVDPPATLALLRRIPVDLLLFQELSDAMADRIERALPFYRYRYWHPHPNNRSGLGVLSRVPFAITGAWTSAHDRQFALRLTLASPNGPCDVYNIHLLAPTGTDLERHGFDGNFRLREEQIALILAEVERRGLPALLMGDHNLTEGSDAYRMLTVRLVDAWAQVGQGPGWTWPRSLYAVVRCHIPFVPLLRLDYCFVAPPLQARSLRVLWQRTGSDHCPILAEVTLPATAASQSTSSPNLQRERIAL